MSLAVLLIQQIPLAWVDREPFFLCSYMLCFPPPLPSFVNYIGPQCSSSCVLPLPEPLHFHFPCFKSSLLCGNYFPPSLTVAHLPLATLCVCLCLCLRVCVRVSPWWLMAGH